MKATVNETQFIDAFARVGRENQFSYEAKQALFAYFEELDESCGTETELDVIAICCDFNEYKNLKEFQEDYNKDYESIEDIEEQTQVIRLDGEGFIIQAF